MQRIIGFHGPKVVRGVGGDLGEQVLRPVVEGCGLTELPVGAALNGRAVPVEAVGDERHDWERAGLGCLLERVLFDVPVFQVAKNKKLI